MTLSSGANKPTAPIWSEFQASLMLAADDNAKMELLASSMKGLLIQFEAGKSVS